MNCDTSYHFKFKDKEVEEIRIFTFFSLSEGDPQYMYFSSLSNSATNECSKKAFDYSGFLVKFLCYQTELEGTWLPPASLLSVNNSQFLIFSSKPSSLVGSREQPMDLKFKKFVQISNCTVPLMLGIFS